MPDASQIQLPGLMTPSHSYKPFRYPWAYDFWKRQQQVHWMPEEVPLGEDSESYLVRVLDGATVLRELTVYAPDWTYSQALQTADGVSAPFNIDVAQISARFGPGPFRRIEVND